MAERSIARIFWSNLSGDVLARHGDASSSVENTLVSPVLHLRTARIAGGAIVLITLIAAEEMMSGGGVRTRSDRDGRILAAINRSKLRGEHENDLF